jgi:hypothetical protein
VDAPWSALLDLTGLDPGAAVIEVRHFDATKRGVQAAVAVEVA